MRARLAILAPLLLLAGCGRAGGEDFQVEMRRAPAGVVPFLTSGDVGDMRALFPGLSVQRTRPSDNEILYTIPGKDGAKSTVLFRLESAAGGKSTIVHTTVEVPAIKATIGGVMKVLSESKLESLLRMLLVSASAEMAKGSVSPDTEAKLSALLSAIAIASNPDLLNQAMNYADNPELLASVLPDFAESFDADAALEDTQRERAEPMERPEEDASEDQSALVRDQYTAEQDAEEAAEPMSDPDR